VRRYLIVGNWKMHKTIAEAAVYVRRLAKLVRPAASVEVVLAPPFTALSVTALPAARAFTFAAQDLFWEDDGAFTGEISALMIRASGCRYVILGHSERRRLFHEQDADINKKVTAALRHGRSPILCVGESLSDRRKGRTTRVITSQLQQCLKGIASANGRRMTIAYEPVWAIGTSRAATPAQMTAVHTTIRRLLARKWGRHTAEQVRILYGGSVKPENVGAFLRAPEVDGALVGGACLNPRSFATIIAVAQTLAKQAARHER
jgi:triosephosphate isomerase